MSAGSPTLVKIGDLNAPTLIAYQLWRPFLRARFLDESSRALELSEEMQQEAWGAFCSRFGLDPLNPGRFPPEYAGLSEEGVRACAYLEKRVQLWKERQFGPGVGDLFLKKRAQLDRVVYRMICVTNEALALELYFRIKNGEATFEALAAQFSTGSEAQSGGQIGPVPFGSVNRDLYEILHPATPGELLPPKKIAQFHLLLKLEKKLPAQLDAPLHSRLLEELCDAWVEERLRAIEQHRESLKKPQATP
jgi:parvulin-like peptidyl-prolyl isomerase